MGRYILGKEIDKMKKKITAILAALASILIPAVVYADIAVPGTIRVNGKRISIIPYILIAAVIIIALVIILKAKKKNGKK